ETRPEPVREVRRALQDVRPEPVGDVPHNLTKALNPEQVRPALHEEREAQATQPIRQTTEQVEPAAEGIRPTTTPRRRTEPERQASPEPPSMGSEEAAAQGVPPRESPRPPAGAPIEAVQAIGLEPRRTTLTELAQEVRQKQQSTPFYKSTPRPPQMPAYGPELESGEAEEPVLGLQVGAYRETEMRRLELRLGHLEETEEHREGRREDGEEQERQRREEEERQERQEAEEEGADADEDEDCDPEPEFALPGEAPGSDASPPELGGLNLGSETHSLTLDGLQAGGGPDLADLGAGSDDLAGLAPGGINQTSARSGEADYLLAATAGLAPLQARRVTALITEYRFTALEARQAVQLGLAPEQSGLTPDEARRAVALCLRSGLTAEQAWKSVTSGLPTTAERHRSGLGLAPRHDEGPLEPPDELAALGFHPGALGHDLRLDDPTGVGLRDLSVDPATRLQRARERKNPPAQAPPVVQAPPETPLEVVEVERGWLAGIVPRRPDPLEWACSPGRTFFWSVTPALNAPLVGVATWARFRRSPWQLDLRKVAPSLESGVPLPHFFAQMVPWLDSRMMAHFYSRATRFISSYAATLLRKAREKRRQLSEEEILNYLLGLLALGGEFTHQHSVRVMKLSIALCRELGMTDRETLRQIGLSALLKDIGEVDLMIERSPKSYGQRVTNFLTGQDLHKAGLLHDLGKLKVPHEILYKPGALTQEEFAVMKMHPIYSEEILWPFLYFRPLCPIVRGHHERWDGKGYPDGLKGEEIPIGARIIALADVFDALFADRPYRAGMPLEKVCKIIAEGRGTHFDPSLVDPFLKAVKTLKLEGQAAPHP
ncbi:HD-GYP domain-containing protein, partial [bacterium CPR1]|nr:HD-GYP domain-containing protein [bacterium CPR1]